MILRSNLRSSNNRAIKNGGDEEVTICWNNWFFCECQNPFTGEKTIFTLSILRFRKILRETGLAGDNLCRTADAQFLDPKTQGAGVEFEDGCGSGLPLDSPSGLLENSQDMLAFHGR
jgi:hypothetical protein